MDANEGTHAQARDANEGATGLIGHMPWLVIPERTVHDIASREALDVFVKQRDIPAKIAGNLRQLLRFTKVGNDRCDANDRSDRHEAGGKGNKQVLSFGRRVVVLSPSRDP